MFYTCTESDSILTHPHGCLIILTKVVSAMLLRCDYGVEIMQLQLIYVP